MPNYKIVDADELDSGLQIVADSIKAKSGISGKLEFPYGLKEAADSITASNVIDNVEIALDFSNGDMTETLPEGYSVSSATILKPDTLIAENIAEGVTIAGIVGTHECECNHNILETVEIAPNFANGDFTESLPDGYYAHAAKVLKPENLTPENIAKDVEIAGIVGTHEGGSGGSVEGTATVTFCNYDGSVLYTRLVFIGDDCASPVTQGKLDTPTRASDVQYNYTFSGWSATKGGSASSTVLKNITADKTVYAAYTTSLVYYTVRFYDGETLMQESQVAYGATATQPDIRKEGYTFVGWTPSDLTITGNIDFYGTWEEAVYMYALDTPTGTTLYRGWKKMIFTKNGERVIGIDSQQFTNMTIAIFDATKKPYTFVTSFKTIGEQSSYVSDIVMNPSGTMFVITHHCRTSSVLSANRAYRVYSVNGNEITDVTANYYTAPSLSGYYYDTAAFNSDGTRLFLYESGSKAAVVFDTTTTPFTELKANTSLSSSINGSNVSQAVASKGDPNVIYTISDSYKFYRWELDTLTIKSVSTNVSGYMRLSNAQDKLYLFNAASCVIYPFDNVNHKLGTSKTVPCTSSSTSANMVISPDDKVLIRGNTGGMDILNLVNDSLTNIPLPDTIFATDANYRGMVFDDSGTKFVACGTKSPFMITYVTDPTVIQ